MERGPERIGLGEEEAGRKRADEVPEETGLSQERSAVTKLEGGVEMEGGREEGGEGGKKGGSGVNFFFLLFVILHPLFSRGLTGREEGTEGEEG